MATTLERSSLHVEGDDDFHAIVHLLIRHGVDYDSKPWPAQFPEIKRIGNLQRVLDGMRTAIEAGTDRAVGFVLDADSPIDQRWQAVRERLLSVDIQAPSHAPSDGFIGQSARFRSRAGVWLMPDNQHDGTLETFLHTLIRENDRLIDHAGSATDAARTLDARFPEVDRVKAVIHTWLAWQERPGCPYGTAIRAKFFRHDSPVAAVFVSWFKRLYGIA